MAIEGSLKCVKYIMFFFNLLFLVVGIGLVVLGIVIATEFSDYISVLGKGYNLTPILIVLLGLVIAIIAFFGCFGSMRENRCMINFFAIAVVFILVVQVIVVILAFVKRDDVENSVNSVLDDVVRGYNESVLYRDFMDVTQHKLHCCGANAYTDYYRLGVFNSTRVPLSCCLDQSHCDPTYMDGIAINDFYTKGCKPKLVDFLKPRIALVAGVAVAVCVLQLLAIIFACCMVRNIDHYEMV